MEAKGGFWYQMLKVGKSVKKDCFTQKLGNTHCFDEPFPQSYSILSMMDCVLGLDD